VLEGPVHLVLGPDEPLTMPIAATVREYFELTRDYWFEWSRYLSVPFEWQDAVIRAAITLKLCSFEESGAIVAALTTSIPEAPDSGRCWDYRYCWLRDAYFVVQALNQLGATLTMEEFLHYIINIAALGKDRRLRPVYAIIPGFPLPERVIAGLRGYRGMGPVRIGNLAEQQVQNDVYGGVVLAAVQMFFDHRLPRMADATLFARLEELGHWAAASALEPDASLWEYRGRARVHTFSCAMCWAACDRLAKIAGVLGLSERVGHWRAQALHIRAAILEKAWDPQQNTFVESFGGEEVDASLLLLQEIGFIAAADPRFLGTLAAVEQRLRHGKHLFRYAAPDDFGTPTVAFTVCTLWYVNALAAVGRRDEARDIFEHVLSCRNHVGLLSEDIDPQTGELWGNFPQTYSMVGLINSAMRLSRTWEEAFWRG
jgi:GH15 family glucan-1,4-alpha-glucosidase